MRNENNNVIPINQKKFPVVGVILFGIIFLYIAINFYIYLSKDTLTIYSVQAESLSEYTAKNALILREEGLVYAKEDGYLNYYLANAARVAKGSNLCSLAEETDIYALYSDYQDKDSLEKEDLIQVKNEILSFRNHFDSSDYSNVLNIRDNITGKINELLDENMLENLPKLIAATGTDISFKTVLSDESGVISYYTDKYTGYLLENMSNDMFNGEALEITDLRTTQKVHQGQAICKIVTSENWQLVFPLSEEEYVELQDKTRVTVYIKKDRSRLTAPAEYIKKDGTYYCILSFSNYMVKYIDDRFLELEIKSDADQGLCVPLSSILKKDFFLIPVEYMKTGDSGNKMIKREVYDENNGSKSVEELPISYIYNDGTYIYVNTSEIAEGSILVNDENNTTFNVSIIGQLEGVYQVNKGYSVFVRIERLYENDEYCIIKNDTAQGLRLYDHIILESDKAQESAIIY